MTIVCIVGSYRWTGAADLIPMVETAISDILDRYEPEGDIVISGESPKGGVDIWARNIAREKGFHYMGYPPKKNNVDGYMARNKVMAHKCDVLYKITSPTTRTRGSEYTLKYALDEGKKCYEVTFKEYRYKVVQRR